jgi:FdhD protein
LAQIRVEAAIVGTMSFDENVALVAQPEALRLSTLAGGPLLSCTRGELLREISVCDQNGVRLSIQVPREKPLTVFVDDQELVTLLTLGAMPEWLMAG